jgi:hypothetical protein
MRGRTACLLHVVLNLRASSARIHRASGAGAARGNAATCARAGAAVAPEAPIFVLFN